MGAMLDLVDAILDLVEPNDDQVAKDRAGEEPLTWTPGTLYAYGFRNADTVIESGPTRRQDWGVRLVFVAPSDGEEATRERKREVSDVLEEKRIAYMAAIAEAQVSPVWLFAQAAESPTRPRTLQTRALAIDITGWRVPA
jgi:hypothetical protein